MKRFAVICFLLLSFAAEAFSGEMPAGDYSWIPQVSSEHPKLFFTKKDLARIKQNAEGSESAVFTEMKKRIDAIISKPVVFSDPLAASGEANKDHEYGFRAAESALVFIVTKDKQYLEFTKTLLRELVAYYQLRIDNNLNITWYAYSQVNAICAYDWIFNNLSKAERAEIGTALFRTLDNIAWHTPAERPARFRENTSGSKSGCYGPPIIPWYLGLAFLGDEGVDQDRCRKLIREGYDLFQGMAAHRAVTAGKMGGGASPAPNYSFGFYPYADFNFIYTMRSAAGRDISEDMLYVLKYLNYLDWIRLPYNREFGFGDVHHYNCRLPELDINAHIFHVLNIYGEKHPEIIPTAQRLLESFRNRRPDEPFPCLRLIKSFQASKVSASSNASSPHSIYFDTMGQVCMRSGTGDDDTYAMFVSGGISGNHKHFDNNNFILYKKGYRALDTGTRPEPAQHLSHYYCRTVAHNCITIRKPGEQMPEHWGQDALCEKPEPYPNDGGQCSLLGSKLLLHEETPDYVHLSSDATECYIPEKAALVEREFIYVMPDLFIVFDRVESTDAGYPKSWLLHTINEPELTAPGEYREESEGGAMICRSLLPKDAVIEKIGGPGKEFWSDGRNWPLPELIPDDWGYGSRHIVPPPSHPQLGHWRLEIHPGAPAKKDFYLNAIMVGDRNLYDMPGMTVEDSASEAVASFEYNGKRFEIHFDKKSASGAKINVQ